MWPEAKMSFCYHCKVIHFLKQHVLMFYFSYTKGMFYMIAFMVTFNLVKQVSSGHHLHYRSYKQSVLHFLLKVFS